MSKVENIQCPKCKEWKSRRDFHKCTDNDNGLQVYCKLCRKKIDKLRHEEISSDPDKKQKKKDQIKSRKDDVRYKIICYLQEHPCISCGEKDPTVLTFDHIQDKKFNISDAIGRSYCWDKIYKEIEKCEVRCSNCHARKNSKLFNFYKNKMQ